MTDSDLLTVQEVAKPRSESRKVPARTKAAKAKKEIQARCTAAGLKFEDAVRFDKPVFKVGLRCGRDLHWAYLEKPEQIIGFSEIDFEKWVFLSDYQAICSYEKGLIEAVLRFQSPATESMRNFRRMFAPAGSIPRVPWDLSSIKLVLEPTQKGLPTVEISPVSETFKKLSPDSFFGAPSIKLSSCEVTTHDDASELLRKLAGSIFFQIDLLSGVVLSLARQPSAEGEDNANPWE